MTAIALERESEEAAVRRRAREVDELFEFALEVQRSNILRRNPDATEEEIERGIVEFLQRRPGALYGDASGPNFRVRQFDVTRSLRRSYRAGTTRNRRCPSMR